MRHIWQRIKIFQIRQKFLKVYKDGFAKSLDIMYPDDNLDWVDFIKLRQVSKSLFILIFLQMLNQLIETAKPTSSVARFVSKVLSSAK